MAETWVESSEGYQNATRGKSVTIMYEIICAFSSRLLTSIHAFIFPSRGRCSSSSQPTRTLSNKDPSLCYCLPSRPTGGSLAILFSSRPSEEPDLTVGLTDRQENCLPETAPRHRDSA